MDIYSSVDHHGLGAPAYLKSTMHSADAEMALPDVSSMLEPTVMDVYSSVSAIMDSGPQRT